MVKKSSETPTEIYEKEFERVNPLNYGIVTDENEKIL